jgi:hypothetical protein
VADAAERGASVLCGGAPLDGPGFFFAPTVLADVPAEAEIMREEPFGPIATINGFSDLDDAIAQANATEYAFAAYLFADSLDTRRRVLTGARVEPRHHQIAPPDPTRRSAACRPAASATRAAATASPPSNTSGSSARPDNSTDGDKRWAAG